MNKVPASSRSRHAKRVFDLLVLVTSHIVLAPVWLILWALIPLAILVDSGRPVFYRTEKVGQHGKVFEVLKFRTMVPDADRVGPPVTRPEDERVTRIGRWLRPTALDELPQLISILKGDMSFVGPRAYNVRSHELYMSRDPRFARRLQVVPGLTGLAAVYGSTNDPRNRLAWDILYVRRQSLWLDFKLLWVSLFIALRLGWERKQTPAGLPAEKRLARPPAQVGTDNTSPTNVQDEPVRVSEQG